MAKRKSKMVQVFIVSWFPIVPEGYPQEAATIQCISRDSANRIAGELRTSFAPYAPYDPLIHIDRTEVRET